jgi:hypothetical protein
MVWRNGFSLWQENFTLPEVTITLIELLTFQKLEIQIWKTDNYLLSQIGSADEVAMYFNMPSIYIIHDR